MSVQENAWLNLVIIFNSTGPSLRGLPDKLTISFSIRRKKKRLFCSKNTQPPSAGNFRPPRITNCAIVSSLLWNFQHSIFYLNWFLCSFAICEFLLLLMSSTNSDWNRIKFQFCVSLLLHFAYKFENLW